VFGRIAIVTDSQFASKGYPVHGGRGETSAMMALCPETVDLSVLSGKPQPRWNQDAQEASGRDGEEIAKTIVAGWREEIGRPK
jgi:creatinine amidohydrolase/Fe(II)-dependent formamide hydrolase-like protein